MNRYDEYINENGLIVFFFFLRKRRKIVKLRNEKHCEKRTRVYIKFAF